MANDYISRKEAKEREGFAAFGFDKPIDYWERSKIALDLALRGEKLRSPLRRLAADQLYDIVMRKATLMDAVQFEIAQESRELDDWLTACKVLRR